MRRRKLKATVAFCLAGGLTFTSKTIVRMRDKSNKERLNTKESAPLTVLRKISSGMGLISISGNDGSSGMLIGSLGIIILGLRKGWQSALRTLFRWGGHGHQDK